LATLYRRALEVALRYRWLVIFVSLAFFGASLTAIAPLKKEFLPPQDQGNFIVRLQTPVDSSMLYTNSRVLEATRESAEYEGMATTVAAVLVDGDVANLAHVGDSRIYLWSDGEIELLTRDHSWVNEQIENGAISPEQARSHPLRNVVTRALGGRADLVVDIQSRRMAAGDMLLLCSDGLTTMIPDDDIARILAEAEGDVTKAANALVGAANERGGEDNITVVLLKFGE